MKVQLYIYYMYADPIDCERDICHLAWLIRDDPNLMVAFYNNIPTCSNGTRLDRLETSVFQSCP